jgi:hypothetical protein
MCSPHYAGSHLRQLQWGFWTAQPGQNLEVCLWAVKIAGASRVQEQSDLPLHQHLPRKGSQLRLPHLRIHCTSHHIKVISLGYTAAEAFAPFEGVALRPFRDAGYAECSYKCTVFLGWCSCWTVCGGCNTRSLWGGSTTRPLTWPSTSTTRRSRTETSTGSSPTSLSHSARPPINPSISTTYPDPHAESHIYAQRLRAHIQKIESDHCGSAE